MGFRSTSWPGISVKGQIRGSASARFGQVQGGSRRMRPPKFLPTAGGGGAMPDPGFTRPDLRSIPTANAEAEPARAGRGGLCADGHLPPGDDPLAPSPRGIDRAIRLSTVAAVLAVVPVPSLARWLLALGIAATLTANMAQGWSH